MASVADYIVIRDGQFSLEPGQAKAFSEHVQNTLVVGMNRVNPILAFKAQSTPTGLGAYTVEVNTKVIYSPSQVQPGDKGGLWEVFDGSILNPGINNTVQFRAIKKSGGSQMSCSGYRWRYRLLLALFGSAVRREGRPLTAPKWTLVSCDSIGSLGIAELAKGR